MIYKYFLSFCGLPPSLFKWCLFLPCYLALVLYLRNHCIAQVPKYLLVCALSLTFFFCFFVFGLHPLVILLLAGLTLSRLRYHMEYLGIKPRLASCKAKALPRIPSLWPQVLHLVLYKFCVILFA